MALSTTTQDGFRRFIKPYIQQLLTELKYDMDFDTSRIMVLADTDTYDWKQDPLIWAQHKGKMHDIYQVYVDGIFICYLSNSVPKKQTLAEFWDGFLKAYSMEEDDPGKLWLDKSIYAVKAKEKKLKQDKQHQEIIKAIEDKKVKSEEQEIAKEVALDVAKGS